MTHAVLFFELSQLSEFAKALERVEELRTAIPVQVQKISTHDDEIAVVLKVPDDSIELVKNALPGVVVVA